MRNKNKIASFKNERGTACFKYLRASKRNKKINNNNNFNTI